MLDMIASQTSIPSQTKSNEWYTPSKYIEAAREVMGSIDLDPASCELANQTVKATKYYTKEDDGLSKDWHGNVWCNPPFNKENGKSTIEAFITKAVAQYETGNARQVIMLVAGQTSSKWFQPMWNHFICFTNHHVHFYCPQLDKYKGQRDCTLFVYLGPNEQRFIKVFSQFGTIAKRVSAPK